MSNNSTTTGRLGFYKNNNFDLIRLLAALQVFIYHGITHLQVQELYFLLGFLEFFPGVPVFFFVSGLLISASWERNPKLWVFYKNRLFRIFPALLVVVLFSTITLIIFYDHTLIIDNARKYMIWVFAQGTVFQFWNPSFLREYGVGVVNGSLWTISVEVSFYLLLPLIYKCVVGRKHWIIIFIVATILSFTINSLVNTYLVSNDAPNIILKLLKVSLMPWIGMFLLGILANRHIELLYRLFGQHILKLFLLYVVVNYITYLFPFSPLLGTSNEIGIINYVILSILVFCLAFTKRELSDRLLKRNDFSYGVYIYHMPIINIFVTYQLFGLSSLMLMIPLVGIAAFISWTYLEKKVLNARKSFLYSRVT